MQSSMMVLVFTDVVGSVDLKQRLGAEQYARLLARHDRLFKSIVRSTPKAQVLKDLGDGFLARFATPGDAVNAALRFQYGLTTDDWQPQPLTVRTGVHLGQVMELAQEETDEKKLVGMAADMTARVMGLALPGQILLTQAAFDEARQYVRCHPLAADSGEAAAPLPASPVAAPASADGLLAMPADGAAAVSSGNGDARTLKLEWKAHGRYRFKGSDEPTAVFEVGTVGRAPLRAPPDGDKATRVVNVDEEQMLGWRPAAGLEVPRRPGWIVERKLGEGGFGEVWLGRHLRTRAKRVFKFCLEANRLSSLKRELTLFRIMQDALGDRQDIARLYEVQLEQQPYFLESEFSELGNLADWAKEQGGIAAVPMATRLDLMARVADAVAAAHSVGVLHKDLKPANILMYQGEGGAPRPKLADFGIGAVIDRSKLKGAPMTGGGFTQVVTDKHSSYTTMMYAPPEIHEGKPYTVQGDWYALGVMLYQVAAGDLNRSLAEGWERNIDDPLLREDIAACVDGDPSRRLSGSRLAERLRTLEQRREEKRAAEEAKRREQERLEALGRQVARRKRLYKAAMGAAVFATALLVVVSWRAVRERALRERAVAAEGIAKAEARKAELERVKGLLHVGDADLSAGKFTDAGARYEAARRGFAKLGHPTAAADLALWDLDRSTSWPLASWWPPGGESSRAKVRAIAVSPDGATFVAAGDDKTMRLRRVDTGAEVTAFAGHTQRVTAVAFDRSGRRLVSGGSDQTVRVWDVATGREVAPPLTGHEASVNSVAFVGDSSDRVASTSWDRTLRVWKVPPPGGTPEAAKLVRASGSEPTQTFRAVATSPDSQWIACGHADGTVRLFHGETLAEFKPVPADDIAVTSVAFSAAHEGGLLLATGGSEASVKLWRVVRVEPDSEAEPLHLLKRFAGHQDAVTSVAFSPRGTRLISGSWDRTLKLWSVDGTNPKVLSTYSGHTGWVTGVAFSGDDRRALSVGEDNAVRLWSAVEPRAFRSIPSSPGGVEAVAVSRDGSLIASAGADGLVRVFDAQCGHPLRVLGGAGIGHDGRVFCLAFSPDGRRVVSGGADRVLRLWDLKTGEQVRTFESHGGSVLCAAFSPDGKRLLSGSRDRSVKLWDVENGKLLHTFDGHQGYVSSVAFDASGTRAASAGAGKAIKLWNVRDRTEMMPIEDAHEPYASAVAFGPGPQGYDDPNIFDLVSCGGDGTVRLWDAQGPGHVRTLKTNGKPFDCVSFTSGGKYIVAGAADGRLTWWDAASGEELRTIQCSPDDVGRFAFAGGGGPPLMASAAPGGVKVWAFAHAARVREQSPGKGGMWHTFAGAPAGTSPPPQAFAAAGEWCALHGAGDWAAAHLAEARRLNHAVSPLSLGRSYLDAGRPADAREQFRGALRDGAAELSPEAAFYLALFDDEPQGEAVAASGAVASATTRPARPPAARGGLPVRFTFESSSHPRGRRTWAETSPGRWEERWPDGTVRVYEFLSRGKADGAAGTIARWPGASNVQMFIPDTGGLLKYRSADTGAWKDWARVELIDTRPNDLPWPPAKLTPARPAEPGAPLPAGR